MNAVNNVDEYIAQAPKEVQEKLKELQTTIKTAAPGAEERMSYGMPSYYYKGRLAYFQYWKKHIGLYGLSPDIEKYKSELSSYVTDKGALQIPLDEELPLDLIKKLVQERVRKNDAVEKKK